MNTMNNVSNSDETKVLISAEKMKERIREMGRQISRDYAGKDLLMVAVLKGSVIFFADLIREISIPIELDFISVSSYAGNAVSSGAVTLRKDVTCNVKGRHIMIVEDIIDTGFTIKYITELFSARETASVSICSALDKPSRRDKNIHLKADYIGFEIPDEFVVGYGLDYDEKYRNLPEICVLNPSVYASKEF